MNASPTSGFFAEQVAKVVGQVYQRLFSNMLNSKCAGCKTELSRFTLQSVSLFDLKISMVAEWLGPLSIR